MFRSDWDCGTTLCAICVAGVHPAVRRWVIKRVRCVSANGNLPFRVIRNNPCRPVRRSRSTKRPLVRRRPSSQTIFPPYPANQNALSTKLEHSSLQITRCHVCFRRKEETPMSRKVSDHRARPRRRWLVRVYLGRDSEMRKRTYHNQTSLPAPLRNAQAY